MTKTGERIIGTNIEHLENVFTKKVIDKVKVILMILVTLCMNCTTHFHPVKDSDLSRV